MAGFELARVGAMGELAREWRGAKFAPLYVAALAAGVAVGIGVALNAGSDGAPRQLVPAVAAPVEQGPFASPSLVLTAPDGASEVLAEVVLPEWTVLPIVVAEPPAPEPAAVPVVAPIAPAAQPPVAARPAAVPESAPVRPAAPAQPAAEAPAAPPLAAPGVYVPAVSGGGLSSMEQRLFDGMNAERAAAGLAPFRLEGSLIKVARTRSQQMADRDYFSHYDGGVAMYTALLSYFGISNWGFAGENLAMNNYGAGEASERSLVTLMNSPGHRANILSAEFTRVGVGEVTTADGRHIFTMIFLG